MRSELLRFAFLIFSIIFGGLVILFVLNAALHNMGYGGW